MNWRYVSIGAQVFSDVKQGSGAGANMEVAETFQDGGMELN